MTQRMTLADLSIMLLGPKEYPDQDITDVFVHRLLKKYPERYSDLLGQGEPLRGAVEFFFMSEEDCYSIWHEVLIGEPGDQYISVDVLPEEILEVRAELQQEALKKNVIDRGAVKKEWTPGTM